MRQYERSGVHVDQCGDCRGIFLDRGELERLVDAESAWSRTQPQQSQPQYAQPQYAQPQYGQPSHKAYKKRKSFLEELFD
ncbi:MAG: zf-TFIIB domain-containing protein [Actinomycetales bacterium]|nr:zf-TFIIB domain-containing protein [Actinomycetales bacterium]